MSVLIISETAQDTKILSFVPPLDPSLGLFRVSPMPDDVKRRIHAPSEGGFLINSF